MARLTGRRLDLVEERVSLCGREISLLRPPDAEALLDEEAFEREEFLPYWAELWPSGLALAHRVCERPLTGARVLELGCGLALPSFAAALRGAAVVASDWSPDAVALAAENAARNGIVVETVLADWGDATSILPRAPWDVVLAADVLYERRNVATLLELLPRLVGDLGEVILAEPQRRRVYIALQDADLLRDMVLKVVAQLLAQAAQGCGAEHVPLEPVYCALPAGGPDDEVEEPEVGEGAQDLLDQRRP